MPPWLFSQEQGLGSALPGVNPVHGADSSPMRIDLKVPYPEKDTAKALGARWDATKKFWYITDVADRTPFLRWIPDRAAASEPAASQTAKAPAASSAGVITRSLVELPCCDCRVLPWEDCEHTATAIPG